MVVVLCVYLCVYLSVAATYLICTSLQLDIAGTAAYYVIACNVHSCDYSLSIATLC